MKLLFILVIYLSIDKINLTTDKINFVCQGENADKSTINNFLLVWMNTKQRKISYYPHLMGNLKSKLHHILFVVNT